MREYHEYGVVYEVCDVLYADSGARAAMHGRNHWLRSDHHQ